MVTNSNLMHHTIPSCLSFTLTVSFYCFGRAVTVCPDEGFSKYMYLGQLMEGLQAIECFQKGVELMTEELQKSQVSSASDIQ